MSKKRAHRNVYRTNSHALKCAVIAADISLKKIARTLGKPVGVIEQYMRVDTPITFKTACVLRDMFGARAIIDDISGFGGDST